MKRTSLKRLTPLRRGRPMRRSRPMRQRSQKRRRPSPEDSDRLDWLHSLPCAVTGQHPVEVHHDTQHRGLGQKSPHSRGIPLAHEVHMDFHAGRGYFRGWDREQRREWQTAMVERYQALWEVRHCGTVAL